MRAFLAGLAGSFLPGSSHLALGFRRAGLIFLLPVILLGLLAWAGAMYLGPYGLLALIVTPGILTLLGLLNLGIALWRITASLDVVRRTHPSKMVLNVTLLMLLATVAIPHFFIGSTLGSTDDFLNSLFAGAPAAPASIAPATATPEPSLPTATLWPSPTTTSNPDLLPVSPRPAPSVGPTLTPFPLASGTPDPNLSPLRGDLPALGVAVPWTAPGVIPWGNEGIFDLLLLGSDAGIDRWSRRTDVILLVEVDVNTGAVAMIGIPRNFINAPYPPGPARDASFCGCQPGLINEMYEEATSRHPNLWPGSGAIAGIGAIRSVVSELTGRPIDAVLIADLEGVIRVIDALGGVDITVPYSVTDNQYPDPGRGDIHLFIPAGRQHMDGRTALAYARSRHQDSDYGRMSRQQTLLLAIRDQIGPSTILSAGALFAAARGMAWTDLPRASLPALISLFGKAAHSPVKQLALVPPTYSEVLTIGEVNQIRKDIAALLPGTPAPAPATAPYPGSAPAPASSPRPSPTPSPSLPPAPSTSPGLSPMTSPSPDLSPAPSPEPSPSPSGP